MTHTLYHPNTYRQNDFIGPVGSWDFRFISGAPQKRQAYLTLIKPFDTYIWAFLLASVVAVTITLIIANKMFETWADVSLNETTFQSKIMCYYINKDHISIPNF